MPGNVLIVIVLIFYGSLFKLLSKPSPSGDYSVGYSFVWLVCMAGFLVSTGLLALIMNLNHCFDWLPAPFLRYRNWLVFLGWICFVVAMIWGLESRSHRFENRFPRYMGWLTWSRVYIWLPLLMLIPGLYLINVQRLAGVAPAWVKIPMQTGFSVSFLMAFSFFGVLGKFWVQRRIEMFHLKIVWQRERQTDWQSAYKASLEYIDHYSEATINGLLKYAHPENEKRQRNAAIAKIKSFENWENDLIGVLTQKDLEKIYVYEDNTYFVYAFLGENKIEHPEKFIQPIIYSLKVITTRVKRSLEDPFNLELGRTGIEVVFPALEAQFKDRASEFRPGVLKLQKALEVMPPERKNKGRNKSYNRTLKRYRLAVKNWLESNN